MNLADIHAARQQQGIDPSSLQAMLMAAIAGGDQGKEGRIQEIQGRHAHYDEVMRKKNPPAPGEGQLHQLFMRLQGMNPFGIVSEELGQNNGSGTSY